MISNLSNRFLDFVANIIKFSKQLNKTYEGRHIYSQLFRSSTSCGANYEESQSAESHADFVHKLQVVLKELKETLFWLKLIDRAGLISSEDSIFILLTNENTELIKIIGKCIVTAKTKEINKIK